MSKAKTFDPYMIIWNCKDQVRDHFYASANGKTFRKITSNLLLKTEKD